jgi:thiol-disulfide isomerase/thioredoxin
MSKSVRFGGMTTLNPSVGGATGMFSGVKGAFSSLSWTTIGIVALVIILGVIIYLTYTNYIQTALNPTYKANRENIPKGQDNGNGKEAEIMLFYTDWCPHCKTAKPEWEQVKAEYNGKQINGYTIIFTEVNCTTESQEVTDMMNTYKIEGYPTIKLVKDNQIIDYDAKPTQATLSQFLNTVV